MSPHTIIYLDQNYLSNMAKARIGGIKDDGQAKFWQSLFDDLREAVLTDKIVCPEAEFHLTEARYDNRLWEPIIKIIKTLSGGLQLRPWRDIVEYQVKDAAIKFLKGMPEIRDAWTEAFMSDPNRKYLDRIKDVETGKLRLWIHVPLTDDDIQIERQRKTAFKEQARKMLEEHVQKSVQWSELLFESKLGVVNGFMGNLAQQSYLEKMNGDYPLEDKLSAAAKFLRIKELWDYIHQLGIDTQDATVANKFVRSNELLDSPFIDINGSIWAAIRESYLQGRDPGEGDLYDVPILASAIPYSDIIATEKYMKELLVNKFQFNDKYNARVFSASKSDRIEFQTLIQEIAST